MGIINRMRKQYAVLWTRTEETSATGTPTFATPVQIDVRWEFTNELFTDKDSQQAVSKGKVYVPVDVPVGSYLKSGPLTGYEVADPRFDPDACETRSFNSIPDLRAKQYLRSCHI